MAALAFVTFSNSEIVQVSEISLGKDLPGRTGDSCSAGEFFVRIGPGLGKEMKPPGCSSIWSRGTAGCKRTRLYTERYLDRFPKADEATHLGFAIFSSIEIFQQCCFM